MLSYRLRHRVEFQEPFEERNSESGNVETVWDTATANGVLLASVPAEVLTGPGREFHASGAKQSGDIVRVNLRWFPGLKTSWRIVWEGQAYNITSRETDITGRREWRLRAEGGVSDGY